MQNAIVFPRDLSSKVLQEILYEIRRDNYPNHSLELFGVFTTHRTLNRVQHSIARSEPSARESETPGKGLRRNGLPKESYFVLRPIWQTDAHHALALRVLNGIQKHE